MSWRNHYILCRRFEPPVAIDLISDESIDGGVFSYFIKGFRFLEQNSDIRGLTVCFAYDATTPLPRYNREVVAVIYGDEHCRIPRYADRVRAVFKCHGYRPYFSGDTRLSYGNLLASAEFLRDSILWLPQGLRHHLPGRRERNMHLMQLGYGPLRDLPLKPFGERRFLMSFQGSVSQERWSPYSLKTLVGTPKAHSRRRMLAIIERLRLIYHTDDIYVRLTDGFQASLNDRGETYSEIMRDTKICLAPRGTSSETLRVFEGLRYGCVVISERLPPHWYYVGSPIIQLRDWSELPALVERFVARPDELRDRHERSLLWWRDMCSESAFARVVADGLRLGRPRAARRPSNDTSPIGVESQAH